MNSATTDNVTIYPAKENLFGMTLSQLNQVTDSLELPKYTARQISEWLYKHRVGTTDDMNNLSKVVRKKLSEHYHIGRTAPEKVQESADGTRKYLFAINGKNFVEAVYIPEKDRHTLCISTQVGCKMRCLFCMTAKQGLQGNMTAGEILNQVFSVEESAKLTNIVYMGMGEPFDNTAEVMKSLEILTADYGLAMSPRRITVSTVGIIPGIITFLEECKCHLAISLHNPFDTERKMLMPVQDKFPLAKVIELLNGYDFGKQRRVSFEYIVFKGFNDSERHIRELSRLLNGLRCRINLIRFHAIPGIPLEPLDHEAMIKFRDDLTKRGIFTTLRVSRGEDILAACGLLSTKELMLKSGEAGTA